AAARSTRSPSSPTPRCPAVSVFPHTSRRQWETRTDSCSRPARVRTLSAPRCGLGPQLRVPDRGEATALTGESHPRVFVTLTMVAVAAMLGSGVFSPIGAAAPASCNFASGSCPGYSWGGLIEPLASRQQQVLPAEGDDVRLHTRSIELDLERAIGDPIPLPDQLGAQPTAPDSVPTGTRAAARPTETTRHLRRRPQPALQLLTIPARSREASPPTRARRPRRQPLARSSQLSRPRKAAPTRCRCGPGTRAAQGRRHACSRPGAGGFEPGGRTARPPCR